MGYRDTGLVPTGAETSWRLLLFSIYLNVFALKDFLQ